MNTIGNSLSSYSATDNASRLEKRYDFAAMSPNEMLAAKNDLVSSGKITLTQNLEISGMIDIPMEGGGGAVSAGTGWMNQKTNWYQKFDETAASAKISGDTTSNATIQDMLSLKKVLLSLQEDNGTANTVV